MDVKPDKNNENTILDFFGNGYIRIPRKVVEGMFSEDANEREYYTIYCALFVFSAFTHHPGNEDSLKTGELVISTRKLEKITTINFVKVHRILQKLEKRGLIKTAYHRDGQLIRVLYYQEITEKYARLSTKYFRSNNPDKETKPVPTAKEKWEKEQAEREEEVKRANRAILDAIYSNKYK